MADTSACPTVPTLQQLALGQMPPGEVEHLAAHCEQCPHCIAILQTLRTQDTLMETMAAQKTLPQRKDDTALDSLIARLSRLNPLPAMSPADQTCDLPTGDHTPPPPPGADLSEDVGTLLAPAEGLGEMGRLGGYRVLRLLGAGGMGIVFEAEDPQLQRRVALKLLRPAVASKALHRQRFLREARLGASLTHDHIAHVYQVGEDRGLPFLAMQLLEGESLDARLKREGRLPTADVLRIGREIAEGLAAAHERGLVHRDVKPGNIWLEEPRGRVKLLDFGLARPVEDDAQLTQSGTVVGTPAFMAPEQARGMVATPRSDLFSLGSVLYRMATGELPFKGADTMSTLTALAVDDPVPPRELNPDLPPPLADLIVRLLNKNPESRPASARAVAEALAEIERGPTAQGARPPRRRRLLAVAAGLLGAAALVVGIVVIIRDKQSNEVGRFVVPPGGSTETREETPTKAAKEPAAPKTGAGIATAPLAPLPPGEPLSPTALVQQPTKLPGVRSWSIVPRDGCFVDFCRTPPLAYRPDGKRLAVTGWDGLVRLFEPQTGRLVQVLLVGREPASLAWSPDGQVLAVVVPSQPVRLWDAETGRLLRTLESDRRERPDALGWAAEGRQVLACRQGRYLRWDAADGKLLSDTPAPWRPAAFSPDGKRVAGAQPEMDGTFLWNTESGQLVRKLSEQRAVGMWSSDGKRLALAGPGALRVVEADTGREVVTRKDLPDVYRVCWSPDGRSLALVGAFGPGSFAPRLLEVSADSKVRLLDSTGGSGERDSIAWSPDGKTVALWDTTGGELSVGLFDAATGKRLRSVCNGVGALDGFALAPDAQTIAVADRGHTLLVSVDTGQSINELGDTTAPLAWSPDGKRLAAAGPNHTVRLWESGREVRVTLTGHTADVTDLAWSPDGKRLASVARGEKRVLIWDADKAERLCEVGPFAAPLLTEGQWPLYFQTHLTWSPDSRLLAFDVKGIGVHIWNVEQKKLANEPNRWKVRSFDFTPSGDVALVMRADKDEYWLRDLASGVDRRQFLPASWGGYGSCDPKWSPDRHMLAVPSASGIDLWHADLRGRMRTLKTTCSPVRQIAFSGDGKLVAGLAGERLHLWETDTGRLRGILLPGREHNGLTVTPDGHYTGNDQVEHGLVMVVQKDDGTQEVLEAADFEQKYGWKNEPNQVHLLQPLPPAYPQAGMPMGPLALVREPAELPEVNSWTIETVSGRAEVGPAAYRPDGKLLATGGHDGTVRIWDTASGKLVRMLVGDPVWCLSWSKDGKILAAVWDKSTLLWEVDTGRLLRRLPFGFRAAWSPKGDVLGLLGGNRLTLWNATSEQVVRTDILPKLIIVLAWSPDGKTLALGLQDKTIRLWDTASGKEVRKLEGQQGSEICGIAWSPDGKRLVSTAYHENSFLVWDAASGRLQNRFSVEVPYERIPCTLAWSPDARTVALGALGLFDPDTGRRLCSFEPSGIECSAAWRADFKQLATFGEQGVHLLDAASGKRLHTLGEGVWNELIQALAWSPDSRRLAVGGHYGRAPLRIVEVATGQRQPGPQDAFHLGAWSPDGRTFAAKGPDNSLQLWDAVTFRPLRSLDFGGHASSLQLGAMQWSPDGKLLAAAGEGHLYVWSAETAKVLWYKAAKASGTLAWSPDGTRLASGGWAGLADRPRGEICVWQRDGGTLLHETPYPAWRLAWSPDGRKLAVSTGWGKEGVGVGAVALLDADSGKLLAKGPETNIQTDDAFHWTPEGKAFVTLNRRLDSGGPAICVWDGERCALLRRTPLPDMPEVRCAAWSPNGRVLACAGDSHLHLYDAAGHPLGVLLPFDTFGQLALTADGHYRGNARVERLIRMVVQKRDGTSETLTPAEFEQKYGWKNEPAKVRLVE